jgi:uncharacterized protein
MSEASPGNQPVENRPPGNRLSRETSPYLLQHVENPVHWWAWGQEALAEAKSTGKPILLSVGYAACHWCHVMAHESFGDDATASVMNGLFVNIKVDREERPDVDAIYMAALHELGEHGGWPLTMFLTSDAEPFWGGTYFPKDARYGRPAFVSVLKEIARIYREEPAKVRQNAEALKERLKPKQQGSASTLPNDESLADLAARLAQIVDLIHGGIRGAPKFPQPQFFNFLWRTGLRYGLANPLDAVELTLNHIAQGGIYDHLAGGFSRYSVDARWLVPHFEKMLYDNAQILECLALCHHEFGDELFHVRAKETVGWLEREMTHSGGAFCASLDADSDGVEGKFYVWTWAELVAVLGLEEARFFGKFYEAGPVGNWADVHYPKGVTILNRLESARPSAEEEARLAYLRRKLSEAREARVRPGLDDKILADWNGLMIAALVNAATLLGEHGWIELAARAYDFIVSTMLYVDRDGKARLAHSWRAGVLVKPGLALDYAAMMRAALAIYEARHVIGLSLSRDYLSDAIAFAGALETYHVDAKTGLLCMAAKDARDVILRLAPTADDAIPNAHPVFLTALARLAGLTGDVRWLARADALLKAIAPSLRANIVGHAGVLNALDLRLRVKEIVTVGPQRAALYAAALAAPFIDRTVMDIESLDGVPRGHPAHAQAQMAGEAAAFVCSGGACSLPARDVEQLLALLRAG